MRLNIVMGNLYRNTIQLLELVLFLNLVNSTLSVLPPTLDSTQQRCLKILHLCSLILELKCNQLTFYSKDDRMKDRTLMTICRCAGELHVSLAPWIPRYGAS